MADNPTMRRVSIGQFGWALTAFFVLTYVLCVASGVFLPNWELHKPWLQFFPGFEWLALKGFLIGLGESVIYAWYVALVFGTLFNVMAPRRA